MTKAAWLVRLDPEWMDPDEQQARKRIHRITQTKQTYTYALRSKRSEVEEMTHDRQNRRVQMMKLALDSAMIDDQYVKR